MSNEFKSEAALQRARESARKAFERGCSIRWNPFPYNSDHRAQHKAWKEEYLRMKAEQVMLERIDNAR